MPYLGESVNSLVMALMDNIDLKFDMRLLSGELRRNEPMAKHTLWKIGGLADFYYIARDRQDLVCFIKQVPQTVPITWIGNGSNLLVRDNGVRGVVIEVTAALNQLSKLNKDTIEVGAGVHCAKLARFAACHSLKGIAFLSGIPGTVGGALAMNAGAYGAAIWDTVTSVDLLNRFGVCNQCTRETFNIGYRNVVLEPDTGFLSCRMRLTPSTKERCYEEIGQLLEMRARQQPLGQPSCGSVFKNPEDSYAARLIDDCGLKGTQIGNACISEKHANFIINLGGATAADIEQLIVFIRNSVFASYGIYLQPEVQIIGE